MYIFVALVLTPLTYIAIFLDLRRRLRIEARQASSTPLPSTNHHPLRHKASVLSAMSASAAQSRVGGGGGVRPSSSSSDDDEVSFEHHPAFLIYPLIYVVCTLPLALGRVGTLASAEVPYWYFCMAGALITSNGWLDVLLWGTTRHTVVFGPVGNADALGLETFAFMRTPPGREFGNIVWVQGATFGDDDGDGDGGRGRGSGRVGAGEAAAAAARRGRSWWAPWTLVRRFFGGVESGVEDGHGLRREGPHLVGRDRDCDRRKDFGILGRRDMESAYRLDHVKDKADSKSAWWRREHGPMKGGIAVTVKKDTVISVVTMEKGDLESGCSTPSPDSVRGHGRDGYFS